MEPTKSVNEWININERLPENGQEIDLWIAASDGAKPFRMSWKWEEQDTAAIRINDGKVTHWMPLPEPPKN